MISKQRAEMIREMAEEIGIEATAKKLKLNPESVTRYARRVSDNKKASTKPILVIPDTHIPYHEPDMIPFLKWVQQSRGCRKRVIHVGDLMDFHSMSFHTSEPDAPSPAEEYERALEVVAEFATSFPHGDLVLGNHDNIPSRKMMDSSLAPSMLKRNNELFGLPKGWDVHPLYYVVPEWNVLVEHGIGSNGKMGCLNTAIVKRCSYVQGHTHSNASVMYSSNYNSTIFGMNVGCLADDSSLAVRYAKYHVKKGVLGCGVIHSAEHAEFVPIESWKNR